MTMRAWVLLLGTGMTAVAAQPPDNPETIATRAVRAIARTTDGQLARYGPDICVAVAGADPGRNQAITARIEARVRDLGLRPQPKGCVPNLQLIITADAKVFVRTGLRSRVGQLKSVSDAEKAALQAIDAPIIAWTRTAVSGRDNERIAAASLTADGATTTAPTAMLRVPTASLLGRKTRQSLVNGLLVIDAATANGKTAQQLADYTAMRLLGNTTDALPPFESILRLFAGDWSAARQITSFDLLYLDGVYRSPPTSDAVTVTQAVGRRIGGAVVMVYQGGRLQAGPAPVVQADPGAAAEGALQAPATGVAGSAERAADTTGAPPEQPDWDVVTITAPRAGPPLWRVRKGDATIVILGTVTPMPPDLEWIDYRVRAAIRRSKRMLVNSDPEAGYLYMRSWTPEAARRLHQPKGRSLFDEIDPVQAARLRAVAAAIGQDDARYAGLRPVPAAMLLNWDWRQRSGLTNLLPVRPLTAQARKYHVPVRLVPQLALLPTLDALPGLTPAVQRTCFDRLLATTENERTRAVEQARAWAKGDLGRLRGTYIAPANCTRDVPADAQRRAAAVEGWNRVLLHALDSHDQSFAIIDVADLLSRDGILARLRATGAEIDIPPDEVLSSPRSVEAD